MSETMETAKQDCGDQVLEPVNGTKRRLHGTKRENDPIHTPNADSSSDLRNTGIALATLAIGSAPAPGHGIEFVHDDHVEGGTRQGVVLVV